MARTTPRSRIVGALMLPVLAAVGLSSTSCSSSSEEDRNTGIKDVKQIVYAVRQHTVGNGSDVQINVAGGMGQVFEYLRYVPGAKLEVRDLATDSVENIIEDFPTADISNLDVSFDATKVVFSMKQNQEDSYHIYWASLTRGDNGKFDIHQLTFGSADDIDPVYVAGDKVAFVTNEGYTEMGTRADEYNHARQATQIATITLAGGDADRKLCSQNISNSFNLFAMADGKVGFSRWEHLGDVNDMKMFAMNPDCTQMVAIGGQHGKPGNSMIQMSETNTPNVFLGIITDRENTIQSGTLIRMDARSPVDSGRFFEEDVKYDMLTPAVPAGRDPSPVGRYRHPESLPDGRIMVSWASGFVNELDELSLTPPDFGIYVYDPETRQNQLVVNYEGSWELYAKPVVKRAEPPILASVQNTVDSSVPTIFGSIDVRETSLFSRHNNKVSGAQFDGTPMDEALKQTKKVRIIEGFSSEGAPGVTMFGLTMHEGAAILGEADVYEDGSWLAAIPPYVPVHLQPVDEFDMSIRSQTLWIQGMPGEDRVCGGCHEDRSKPVQPGGQALTIAAGKQAQDFNKSIAERTELPWYGANPGYEANEVQALLNAKCVQCHNQTTNGNGPQETYELTTSNPITGATESYPVPRMDLSDRPITVTYDNKVDTYPASYVSIFYPAALDMVMGDTSIVGTVPPIWGDPANARGSALIEKLNMTSSLDANKTAWKLGEAFSNPDIKGGTRTMHPENVGVDLTREERAMLIRAIDLGGQYYARQNSAFQPNQNDPVKGSGTQY